MSLTFSNLIWSDFVFLKKKFDSDCVFHRMAAQRSEKQPEDVFIKTKKALVCFDTQFFGLL